MIFIFAYILFVNSVAASYNFATFIDERREMLQVYADYLDSLKTDYLKNN